MLIGGVAVMVAIVVAGVLTLLSGSPAPAPKTAAGGSALEPPADPNSAAQQYLQDFAAGETGSAGRLTDDPGDSAAALADAWRSLSPSEVQTTLRSVSPPAGNTATAAYNTVWTLSAGRQWSYDGTFGLVLTGGVWRVHWTPAVLQPTLQTGQRLALLTTAPNQTAVVDRDGKPLVTTGPAGPQLTDPVGFKPLKDILASQASTTSNVFAVQRVDAAGHSLQTLFGSTGDQVKPRSATLSSALQSAAQSVVDGYSDGPAVIVAIQPSTGGLLAVAQNGQSTASPFSGLYAPGSTFKIVTATAALESGMANPDSALPCPLTAQIGTRTISNEGFALGTTSMREAFAKSCNTTFAQLASQLPANGLANAADQYGLNADFGIPGLNTQTGKVVPASSANEQVEDGIGQGTVQVSPFGEALMAATVAAGHAVTPRLWQDAQTGVTTGYTAPPAGGLASLRTMMRAVVTGGTATGLAGSGPVYGKTGTAQFGSGDEAHGWFVGYRGDLAFVVFLESSNDSSPAVTLAAQFLAKVS
ncbi:MAG TPA: penicillin-binding transpeptidase domain-containing protein [Pseudonocardiaceae bacterium]|nr:penicillin-binding transpeptidase domain-containing protein [Pseudonocardiaceae bacterium]